MFFSFVFLFPTGELASSDVCLFTSRQTWKLKKNKNKTNVSVQTSTIVTENPLAISMVTIKPTVQRLCGMTKRQAKNQRRSDWPALYRYEMTQNGMKSGRARIMCSAINSFFWLWSSLYNFSFLFLLFTVVQVCRLLSYYNVTLQMGMCRPVLVGVTPLSAPATSGRRHSQMYGGERWGETSSLTAISNTNVPGSFLIWLQNKGGSTGSWFPRCCRPIHKQSDTLSGFYHVCKVLPVLFKKSL